MHTLHIDGGYIVTHNGDFSGDVRIRKHDGAPVWLPFRVLEDIVAEKVRADRIGALEEADTNDLLA